MIDLSHIWQAAKRNFVPALILQIAMGAVLAAYILHEPTRQSLGGVAHLKKEYGYLFSFLANGLAAGLLPEILSIACFQGWKIRKRNLSNAVFGFFFWGLMGMLIDFFYRCQGVWFGNTADVRTVAIKVCVDMFIFSAFLACPMTILAIRWRDRDHHSPALREISTLNFLRTNLAAVVVANWAVWIPIVSVVYAMPPELQIPICVTAEAFWVMLLTTMHEIKARKEAAIFAP
ncbi:MAG: hypothetical protein ABIP97_02150 [Chthoniobacterales bacterium]